MVTPGRKLLKYHEFNYLIYVLWSWNHFHHWCLGLKRKYGPPEHF